MIFTVIFFIAAGLIGAGLIEATLYGAAYRYHEQWGTSSSMGFTLIFFILSLAGYIYFWWYWHLFWFALFLIRLAVLRGKSHRYEEEPKEPIMNYGQFKELDSRADNRFKMPDDSHLRELVAEGKMDEARGHAREMMKVARSVGDENRASEYWRWLGG